MSGLDQPVVAAPGRPSPRWPGAATAGWSNPAPNRGLYFINLTYLDGHMGRMPMQVFHHAWLGAGFGATVQRACGSIVACQVISVPVFNTQVSLCSVIMFIHVVMLGASFLPGVIRGSVKVVFAGDLTSLACNNIISLIRDLPPDHWLVLLDLSWFLSVLPLL